HPIGKIEYWNYMKAIYDRTQNGTCHLSQNACAYLCLGILWARNQCHAAFGTIESMLKNVTPAIDNDLLLAKLYTEWGIFHARERQDQSAEKKFRSVIDYNPTQIPVRTELGRLLSRQPGREGEAEEFLREILT